MADNPVVFSKDDVAELKTLLATVRNQRKNPANRPAVVADEYTQAPEVYVALVPAGGIPARSGTTLGSADCQLYRSLNGVLDEMTGVTRFVYNLSTTAIAAASWLLIERDKWGAWYPTAVVDVTVASSQTWSAVDGSPVYTNIQTVYIAEEAGLGILQPGGQAGFVELFGKLATVTQNGIVDTITQTFAGWKYTYGNFVTNYTTTNNGAVTIGATVPLGGEDVVPRLFMGCAMTLESGLAAWPFNGYAGGMWFQNGGGASSGGIQFAILMDPLGWDLIYGATPRPDVYGPKGGGGSISGVHLLVGGYGSPMSYAVLGVDVETPGLMPIIGTWGQLVDAEDRPIVIKKTDFASAQNAWVGGGIVYDEGAGTQPSPGTATGTGSGSSSPPPGINVVAIHAESSGGLVSSHSLDVVVPDTGLLRVVTGAWSALGGDPRVTVTLDGVAMTEGYVSGFGGTAGLLTQAMQEWTKTTTSGTRTILITVTDPTTALAGAGILVEVELIRQLSANTEDVGKHETGISPDPVDTGSAGPTAVSDEAVIGTLATQNIGGSPVWGNSLVSDGLDTTDVFLSVTCGLFTASKVVSTTQTVEASTTGVDPGYHTILVSTYA